MTYRGALFKNNLFNNDTALKRLVKLGQNIMFPEVKLHSPCGIFYTDKELAL